MMTWREHIVDRTGAEPDPSVLLYYLVVAAGVEKLVKKSFLNLKNSAAASNPQKFGRGHLCQVVWSMAIYVKSYGQWPFISSRMVNGHLCQVVWSTGKSYGEVQNTI